MEQIINQGLSGTPACRDVPVGVPVTKDVANRSLALAELLAQGLVQPGQVHYTTIMGETKVTEGYVFTEAATALVQKPKENLPSWTQRPPCFQLGTWKVTTIQALDTGTDATGKLVTTVRANVAFEPRDWLKATKTKAQWAPYWADIESTEKSQWLYHLLKSGDDYFYTGPGSKLQ
ncbi:MAG: hypothetical protein A3F78_03790 [Burkholderiales bacterium RIFCSPLOWO2_12_FULL_61_40]|nr:MAG: hypothetical protein A3F78_03790 [Burkholderiales bacterium RIFCSPLOWO2_12_FULL_61_40]